MPYINRLIEGPVGLFIGYEGMYATKQAIEAYQLESQWLNPLLVTNYQHSSQDQRSQPVQEVGTAEFP